jgi:hypothetical protein
MNEFLICEIAYLVFAVSHATCHHPHSITFPSWKLLRRRRRWIWCARPFTLDRLSKNVRSGIRNLMFDPFRIDVREPPATGVF